MKWKGRQKKKNLLRDSSVDLCVSATYGCLFLASQGHEQGLRHFVNHASKLRLEVRSFVHVNNVTLSQFIQHRCYLRQSCSCSGFVSSLTQVTNSVTCSFCVVVVVCFACCRFGGYASKSFYDLPSLLIF